jgi:hypothetical protein
MYNHKGNIQTVSDVLFFYVISIFHSQLLGVDVYLHPKTKSYFTCRWYILLCSYYPKKFTNKSKIKDLLLSINGVQPEEFDHRQIWYPFQLDVHAESPAATISGLGIDRLKKQHRSRISKFFVGWRWRYSLRKSLPYLYHSNPSLYICQSEV